MSEVKQGQAALDVLYESDEKKGYASFNSGTNYKVKVLGSADLMTFFNYGIWKVVDSFVPETPSNKSKKGYPIEDLTPWDLAWKYHKDKSEHYQDEHGTEASKYRAKKRVAMGFLDLDSGEQIVIDVSFNQAQAIHGVIKKNEKKIGKKAFELSKEGSGKSTIVSLMPEDLEDLTDKQRKAFDGAPTEFDVALFEDISYEADYDEQIERLVKAGFDVSLIGLEMPNKADKAEPAEGQGDDDEVETIQDIEDSDLPF